jgi:hypothetical protein
MSDDSGYPFKAIAKSFYRFGTCSKSLNPPYLPFFKGGNLADFL